MATIVTGDQSIRIGNKLAEIQRQLYLQRGGYPFDPLSLEEHLQAAVEGRFQFQESFDVNIQLSSWSQLYKEEFDITLDISNLKLPERKEGFDRLIIVAKGMTLNKVYDACHKHFQCWRYTDDLDTAVPTNDRTPTETYAIWVRDRVEADEELKNLSADNLAEKKIAGITLLERILLELKYFRETGKHLDIKNWTFCSGSRDSRGCVPCACWRGGRFGVRWDFSGSRDSGLRSRAAVSL